MSFLSPPKTNYNNYYEVSAFDLTWSYNQFMAAAFFLIFLAGAVTGGLAIYIGLICWVIPFANLFILNRTKKFELVASIQVALGCFVPGGIILMNYLPNHTVEVLFMISAVLYAFMVLKRKFGVISLVIQFTWFVLIIFKKADPIEVIPTSELIAYCLCLLCATVLFGFLIVSFLKLRKNAELKYVSVNNNLNEIYNVMTQQHEEKTVMLKEIHHRVKNNLQVISSLLRLQSYEIAEEASRLHFQDAIYRVSAMALIHEKMYQNENLSQINLENYIESLAADLVVTHSSGVDIKLKTHSEIQELGNDTLVPVALILNELMTNSMKHAFVGQSEGFIEISLTPAPEKGAGYFNFIYKDSGVWRSQQKDSSFGLELIATLTEQLDGMVERTNNEGTIYTFILRDLK